MKPAEPAGVASRSASAPSPAAPPALMRLLRAQAGEWIHGDTTLLCLPSSVPSAPDKAVVPTMLSRTTAALAGEGRRQGRAVAGAGAARVRLRRGGRFAASGHDVLPARREHEGRPRPRRRAGWGPGIDIAERTPSGAGRSRRREGRSRGQPRLRLRRAPTARPEILRGFRRWIGVWDVFPVWGCGPEAQEGGTYGADVSPARGCGGGAGEIGPDARRCLPRAGVWDAQCASVGRTG